MSPHDGFDLLRELRARGGDVSLRSMITGWGAKTFSNSRNRKVLLTSSTNRCLMIKRPRRWNWSWLTCKDAAKGRGDRSPDQLTRCLVRQRVHVMEIHTSDCRRCGGFGWPAKTEKQACSPPSSQASLMISIHESHNHHYGKIMMRRRFMLKTDSSMPS